MKKDRFDDQDEKFTVTGSTRQEVKYWNKLFEIPADESPFQDLTGEDAVSDQTLNRETLYLAGYIADPDDPPGPSPTRYFDVQEGVDLVVPLISLTESELKGETSRNELCKAGMSFLLDDIDNDEPEIVVKDVFLKIDLDSDKGPGDPDYSIHLDVSGATYDAKTNKVDFSAVKNTDDGSSAAELAEDLFNYPRAGGAKQITVPDDNVFTPQAEPGESLACTNGYFATIEDLPEGTHTIVFGGTVEVPIEDSEDPFLVEIEQTDILTII